MIVESCHVPCKRRFKVDYVFFSFRFEAIYWTDGATLDERLKFDLWNISCTASEIRSLLPIAELTYSILVIWFYIISRTTRSSHLCESRYILKQKNRVFFKMFNWLLLEEL